LVFSAKALQRSASNSAFCGMPRVMILAIWMLAMPGLAFAQRPAQKQTATSDQLGMTCTQILQMSSTDWVAQFNGKVSPGKNANAGATDRASETSKPSAETPEVRATLRAIAAYGKCYDARTDRLAASLAKTGKGPLMGVRASFRDFEAALKDFTAISLGVAQPPDDAVKTAYAALYEKQFRYALYQSYEQKLVKQPPPAAKDTAVAPADPAAAGQKPSATRITDPMTLAKNRFGDFLAALPEDKRREIHVAFGEIFDKGPIGEQWKVEVYHTVFPAAILTLAPCVC
jgi:hypothetical protein